MNPVRALRIDLRDAGVPAPHALRTCIAYRHALCEHDDSHWKHFYILLYQAVAAIPQGSPGALPARRSLQLILEDDLGTQLFREAPAAPSPFGSDKSCNPLRPRPVLEVASASFS
jgi:hypothetical protein